MKDLTKVEYKNFIEKGHTYATYLEQFETLVLSIKKNEPVNYLHSEYVPLNFQRSHRVSKTIELLPEIFEMLTRLNHPITWLILTEFWCGDAAQNLPVFNKIAELSKGMINVSVLLREENLDLMDHYLTNGGRSIPKIIQFDMHQNVTGYWGPRPVELQKLAMQWKSDPTASNTYKEEIQRWYLKDNGKSVQKDVLALLKRATAFCADCMI